MKGMDTKDRTALTAPCGLGCFTCELFEDNLTEALADQIQAKLGVPRERIACRGCRIEDGRHFHLPAEGCATLDCAKRKGAALCSDCSEFPCLRLAPLADRADRYPHNMKLYNLCRIRKVGLEKWSDEEAGAIRQGYFKGRFVVGKGQAP
jgi:hypothetical protein